MRTGRGALCLALCVSMIAVPSQGTSETLFDFHSGFWINLHHFLYLKALSEKPQKGARPAVVSQADAEVLTSLSEEKRAAWNAAVSYYVASVIQHDLLFDRDMGVIKNGLENAEASPDLANVDIPPALRAALQKAAPIYREHWWKRHDAQNRQWIAELEPLVEKYGKTLSDSLVAIYGTHWPAQPVRVDTTVYAGLFGAYTTDEPTRPTISTTDPANQGIAALEIVFHETSHGIMEKVMDAIRIGEADTQAHTSNEAFHSGTLWHAVLFYTAGELVSERIPNYIPYADKNGLWTRAWPGPVRSLIEQDWKPHMHGSVGLQPALTKLCDDLALAQSRK